MTVTSAGDPEGYTRFGDNLVCLTCGAKVANPSKGAPIDGPKVHTEWHAKADPK